ncbi:MAG: nucleotidyltransferase domain-containing protein [Methanotrichaceae archaeon]|nr:nucleotidyltransferase domain-containing protein [Methanotrichaceae archaeon]
MNKMSPDQRKKSEELEAEVKRIVERLEKDRGVKLVLLFGSMARGDQHSGSDIDLIVVRETDKKFLDRLDEFYDDAQEAMDVLVYTPEEFESMRNRPFVKKALAEGMVLYAAR